MSCLDERRLLSLHFGDGSDADRRHAAECPTCGARLGALKRDLGRIDAVLGMTTPPRRRAPAAPVRRLVPLAAIAVLLRALAVHRFTRAPLESADETLALADELADDIAMSLDDDSTASAPRSTCPWGDPLLGVGCDEPAVMQIAWR